jgi:hypothetical protein
MGFSHAQATAYGANVGGTPTAIGVLTSNPAVGDLVCCMIFAYFSMTLLTVKDGNGNSYTVTPHSPSSAEDASAGSVWLAYLLNAPANADKTITATFAANPSGASIFVDDFTVAGGTAAFDSDAAASAAGATSPIATPSITPSGSGELFYSGACPSSGLTGVGGSWVQNSAGVGPSGEDAAYILSVSSATALNFTFGGTQDYDSIEMAFTFTPAGSAVFEDDAYRPKSGWTDEPTVSVW